MPKIETCCAPADRITGGAPMPVEILTAFEQRFGCEIRRRGGLRAGREPLAELLCLDHRIGAKADGIRRECAEAVIAAPDELIAAGRHDTSRGR
jgi:hypothetical protein